MTMQDTRQESRRRFERRFSERRQIYYKFGSPEWINAIRKNYLLWPKHDRRIGSRRAQERRSQYRRQKHAQPPRSTPHKNQHHDLLTEAEKQLLYDLSQLK